MSVRVNGGITGSPVAAENTEIVEEALGLLAITDARARVQWLFLAANKPLPFEELLAPFVFVAARRFIIQCGSASRLLEADAHLTLQRHLLQVLTSLSLDTFYAQFTQQREKARTNPTAQEESGEQVAYHRFLLAMRQGGLADTLDIYGELKRLLTTTCELWIAANVEFVQRLEADQSLLAQTFAAGEPLGTVIQIQPALSDPHAGRRCVMALTFSSGMKLIYKPRSLGMEEAFYALLRWCNAHGATPSLKTPALLNRSTYGWMECIAYAPCQDQQALRRYYQRAGLLLCLVYALGGRDCFYDHLIAHGEQPVLVDASALMQPYPRLHQQYPENEGWEQACYSVLHTGWLATWQYRSPATIREADVKAPDISALGLDQIPFVTLQDTERAQLSQQSLTLKHGALKAHPALHIAFCFDPAGHPGQEELHADLSAGFQQMYRLLLKEQTTLLAADGPLQAFKTQTVRVIYRSRAAYEQIFSQLLEPETLRDATHRGLLLKRLEHECMPTEWFRIGKHDYAHWQAVSIAERQTLLQQETPWIGTRADSDALTVSAGPEIASCLCEPAFDLLLTRVKHLSSADLQHQFALLQRALSREELYSHSGSADEMPSTAPSETEFCILSAERMQKADQPYKTLVPLFLSHALRIADDIAGWAVDTGEGTKTWLDVAVSTRIHRYQLQPIRAGLSDGVSGIALFLAAAARISGRDSYRHLALAALRPLHDLLYENGTRLACEIGLGAGLGLGSLVYALTRLAQFLEEPVLLVDAYAAARLITPALIADDRLLDVFVGSAGAILGLLTLYDAAPAPDLLELALCCAQRLLAARTPSQANFRTWPTLAGQHTTGFAHGAAGVSYALLRLYERTGDNALMEAAQEGLHFEDCAFVSEANNWKETLGDSSPNFTVAWCHGATGIGLARIGGLPVLDTPLIRRDIEAALDATLLAGSQGVDHLCCGICGRVEMALTAAQRLARPELANEAALRAEQMLVRAEKRGAFFLNAHLPRWVEHPRLFQGTAGIGYTLLRLAQPEALPSILLWE